MKIKWDNIFKLIILIGIIVLLFKLPAILDRMPNTIELPMYVSDNPTFGVMSLGLICITIIAVAKILSNR